MKMVEPLPKPVPTTAGNSLGNLYRDSIPIFINEDILEKIIEFSEQDLSRERGGFLVGGLHRDRFLYVEIRHFLPALAAQSRAASLTFTHDTWSAMNRQVESHYPDELVLGWQHTHPGFGVFLSGYDLFIHRNFFNHPWQVALVVDPKRQEFGFFQWRNGRVRDCGFVAVKSWGKSEKENRRRNTED